MATRTEVRKEFPPTPLVQLRNVAEGTTFIGRKLKDVRTAPNSMGGTNYFYEFAIISGTAEFVLKQGDAYNVVKPAVNDTAVLCATKPLHEKLSLVPIGAVVEIEYRGKKKNGKKPAFHDYGVFTVED